MAVPASITDLSITAASNSPAGADTVAAATGPDDYLRAAFALLRREQAQGAAVASAATVDLGAIADGNYVHITGSVSITALGTVAAGVSRTVVFDAALTLTHNSTSLILPGGANITTAAGDVAEFVSEGSGNWRCVGYVPAAGKPATITDVRSLYPVGSIYINASVATNPGTLLGFGTWEAFGAGRVMVGLDATNTAFDTAEETGGSADATLVSHTHTATVTDPGHLHTVATAGAVGASPSTVMRADNSNTQTENTSSATTGITVANSTEGAAATNANLQPYVVVYMWKRTA